MDQQQPVPGDSHLHLLAGAAGEEDASPCLPRHRPPLQRVGGVDGVGGVCGVVGVGCVGDAGGVCGVGCVGGVGSVGGVGGVGYG